jgi:mRNA interferase HigB
MDAFMAVCRNVERTHWRNLNDVRASFPHADLIGNSVCFNVCGNTYRVIARIRYRDLAATDVLIHLIMTHPEYDKWWKGK